MNKNPLRRCLWTALLTLLTACGTVAPPTSVSTSSTTITPAASSTSTFTPAPPTALPMPSTTPYPTEPPWGTPIPPVLPKFPLDGYILLFVNQADHILYFQDGENKPVKLAYVGQPSYQFYNFFHFSDDQQKVVFTQDDGNIYSINTDGTHKQVIIPRNWVAALEAGTRIALLRFVPQTHTVFFEAKLCKEKPSVSLCSVTIFLADTDTGKIRKLADLGMALQNYGIESERNIRFSPNGEMMAVGAPEGIQIFTLDGRLIRQNILPFTPVESEVLFPELSWLPDSSGLIAALPDTLVDVANWGETAAYSIWRYSLSDNSTVQIPLVPPVVGQFAVSPDGNWIAYYGGLESTHYDVYLANLADGSTKRIRSSDGLGFSWSLDSKHFLFGTGLLASLDGPLECHVSDPSWIDANHFMGIAPDFINKGIKIIIAEIRGNEVYHYETGLHLGLVVMGPKR